MEFSRPPLVIAFELSEKRKAIVADALAGASDVVYLTEVDEAARAEALRNAGVLLTYCQTVRSGSRDNAAHQPPFRRRKRRRRITIGGAK